MGCACLRGDGRHWPHRGSRRVATGGRQQDGVAHQLDAACADARAQLLRSRGDADAIWLGDRDAQLDADSDPDSDAVGIGQPISDRDRRRFTDAMPIAGRHGDAITVTERHP
jgi:hypothetical protein